MNTQMQMPERVQIEETSDPNTGRFVLQPLEQGYGVTLGNSFRRVILSSIPGAAITGIKISDVLHEFQTIPGVVEDVSDIILNLKDIRFKSIDRKAQRVIFNLKGPGTWTAENIQNATDQIEIINPEHHIATLAEDAEFEVELRLGRGRGYIPSEEQTLIDFPIGMLPIDAIFTPIKNVIYKIEPYRVGQKTDYEKLVLDITTDGTITPQEALHYAAKILQDHVKYFASFEEIEEEKDPQEAAEDEVKEAERNRLRKILLTPVDELELSVRAHNCLKAANIKNLSELVSLHEHELLKFRNFGRKSLTELTDVVHTFGLDFGMNVDRFLKDEPEKSEYSENF
jgi:DNA-directed RNA polymerase subunit alpha